MLKPKRRITKKELKQDEFLEFLYKAEQFVRKHARVLSYIGAGIAVVVLVGILMYNSRQQAEQEAAGVLGAAQASFDQGNYEEVIDQLTPMVETYSGTNSAGVATFYIGSSYYRMGEYEQAEEYFSRYLNEYDADPTLSASAHASLGSIAAENGDMEEAAEEFREAMRRAPYKFLIHRYSLEAAHYTFEAGNTETAKTLITNLLTTDDLNSGVQSEAEALLETIEVTQKTN
ncbi:MAG: tetratricopeptide repeat protein [Candidatus Marinimicrobia bacterium]|nr:tetratricopeptide repeat protein [Candidatus Neomarinimicrobiota bacterium]MCF7880621.1 tetratricopeptide repeat protein [Candidatus Neomarinimicrobiota bacterium]